MLPSRVGNPMERVALDILGPLPKTKHGNQYILAVSDYFTRWSEAFSLPNQEAITVAQTLVNEWICRFGAPDYIHSDQGRKFKANLFTELCQLLGLTKTRTSPYHPQSDELVGRLNQTPLMTLSIAVEEDKEKWDEHLLVLMVAYHLSVHDTTGFTPIYLMYGREIQLPLDVMFGQAPETMHNRV